MRNKLLFLLSFFIFNLSTYAFAQDKLVFALDVIRHGDRTAINSIPTAPHTWAEGPGELTELGMQQEFELGAKHRQTYMINTKLLPEHYQYDTIYVCSTDYDRTLMSAESFLLGLYPLDSGAKTLPHQFQPVPIHLTMTANQENLIPDANVKKFEELMEKYVYPRQDWHAKTNEVKEKFSLWSKLTGMQINSLSQLTTLGDILFVDQIHQVSFPAGLSESDAQQIIDMGHWAFAATFKPHEVGVATTYPLLKTITDYLQQASQQKTNLKWVLFSAHDSTLAGLMSVLQAPVDTQPHYASNLNFALFAKSSGDYYVKVTFNDKPVVLPACGGETCTLQQFVKFVQSMSK